MRIARLAPTWIFASAALCLLALPAGFADSAPTSAELRSSRARAGNALAHLADTSPALVRSVAMIDRLRSDDAFARPGRGEDARPDRPDHRAGPAAFRGGHGGIDLRAGRRFERGGSGSPTSPIPEPSSILLLAAGGGVVAYVIRRKLA